MDRADARCLQAVLGDMREQRKRRRKLHEEQRQLVRLQTPAPASLEAATGNQVTSAAGSHPRTREEKEEVACDDVAAEDNSSFEDNEVESSDVGSREEKIELESAESEEGLKYARECHILARSLVRSGSPLWEEPPASKYADSAFLIYQLPAELAPSTITTLQTLHDQPLRSPAPLCIDELLKRSIDGELPHGAQRAVARHLDHSCSVVGKIWARYTLSIEGGIVGGEWQSRIQQNSGRKRKDRSEIVKLLQALPIEDRSVERCAASLAGVSLHLVRSLVEEGGLSRVTARIRSTLMAGNKLSRVDHCLIFIDDSTLEFECMDNVVHVDEKWFYEDKDKRSYLLFSGEEPPHTRRVKASGSSPRPCSWQPSLDHDMTLIDSALGRKARAVAIDGGVCSAAVVIDRRRPIMIQQDNAKPHVLPHDSDVVAAGMEGGWCIRLLFQPPIHRVDATNPSPVYPPAALPTDYKLTGTKARHCA
ncbi:hypothetical protein PC120_g19076 [Phytophthora cactorum]|nr:hypothetical protein PC120_g19076 [Phytophthora cactorum]